MKRMLLVWTMVGFVVCGKAFSIDIFRIIGFSSVMAFEPYHGLDDPDFFRNRVAPILEKHCLSCHGEVGPKGGLDLSTKASLESGGTLGPAVVDGHSDESMIIEKVIGDPPEMPKKSAPLSASQVADLRAWIDRGAVWPDGLTLHDRHLEGESWWAFEPLVRPGVPVVRDRGWGRTDIDAFILDALEKSGLEPTAEADRRTLIRRLTFDLHGLSPTPAEIDAFLNDQAPNAYETLVDRLLASPRYGERWGRHWLDVVHYGDTHGYDKDKRRDHAWPYRDYVIKSLNDDIAYSRFIQDQIAGDVLFPGEPASTIATGFIAAGPWDFVGHVELREGTVDKLKARLNDRDDMLANTMSTFQSMTVHCARCHDHKFDPIPQKDYYKLQAVFAGVDRGDRPYSTKAFEAQTLALKAEKKALQERQQRLEESIGQARAKHHDSDKLAVLDRSLKALHDDLAAHPKPTIDPPIPSPSNGYHSEIHDRRDSSAHVQVDLGQESLIDLIRLVPARPVDFPDTPGFGFPERFKVELSNDPAFPENRSAVVESFESTESNGDESFAIPLDRPAKARFVRVSADRLWRRTDDYVFALSELEVVSNGKNLAFGKDVKSLDSIESGLWSRAALVDGFDSRTQRPGMASLQPREAILVQIRRTSRERTKLLETLVPPALLEARQALENDLGRLETTIKAQRPTELVYTITPHAPRPIPLLRRGDVEQPGEIVGPGALSCLRGLESDFKNLQNPDDEGLRRAALAAWLASPKNVLTWRSIVNRVWHFHFGRGLVDTPNDFGRNGSKPTHPELLDWLAADFLEHGQSLKNLHRLILRSAVYRQSSQGNKHSETIDADNRKLWRMNRQRLDAESIRDSVLAITGTLDNTMGGPGFDLFKFKDDHSPIYDHVAPGVADNPAVRRRTVYRFVVRSVPNPFLESLDCADPNLNTPVRPTTITALQALALFNDPFIASQSAEFAAKLDREGGTLDHKINSAYSLVLGRPPRDFEREALVRLANVRGLAMACRVLLNTNEFMFVD